MEEMNNDDEIGMKNNNGENEEIEEEINSIVSESKKSNNIEINNEDNCSEVINGFLKIKNCTILQYGVKPTTEKVKFGYCRTCDLNLMNPICEECLYQCHKKYEHNIREINEPDNIICGCGERMHKFIPIEKKNRLGADECPYSDWCEKSGLSALYIVDERCVCEFCYRICGYDGKGKQLEKEKEMLQVCECEKLNGNLTHVDFKHIFRSLEELICNKGNLIMDISPEKFFNLLFLGKSSYESIFFNFEEMIQRIKELNKKNKLELKDNFLSTNFYISLTILYEILEKCKGSPLRYFADEIVTRLSFKIIKNLLENIVFKDNKVFWDFLKNMLYLYKKITIGSRTMSMDKYKIRDLMNFPPLLRKIVFMTNSNLFPEATEQIEFFIKILNDLLNQEIKTKEVYDVIIEICGILKRLSGFYLFNNINMVRFCFAVEKSFSFSKFKNSHEKQIRLFSILTKIFVYFIYNYNDTSIYDYVLDKKGDINKIKFVFYKNELGRLISRNVIRMMYYALIVKKYNRLSKSENNMCSRTLYYGTQVLELMFTERDTYYMNYINRNILPTYLFQVISIKSNNDEFILINSESEKLGKLYYSFFIFDIDKKELIKEVNNILEKIINMSKNADINAFLLKSNFCFIICKIFYIIDFNELDEEKEDSEFNNIIKIFFSNFFLFLYYFIENNEFHALILCSHYILQGILKIPVLYTADIFKIYAKCSKLIKEKRCIIDEISIFLRSLFNYLVDFKAGGGKIFKEVTQDFFLDEFTIGDQAIFYFLIIVIKIFLQTKILHPMVSIEKVKKLTIEFLQEFEFSKLHYYNECLTLILINKLFNSCDQSDRELIMKLIPIQKIVANLEKTEIEVDFRTELLIYLKQFKLSTYFKQIEGIKKKYNLSDIQARAALDINNSTNVNVVEENKSEKKRQKGSAKPRKRLALKGKDIIVETNIVNFFSLNDEENTKYNNYLNAIGQDGDNFDYIKNNPLISNYKYPTNYLTLYYFFLKTDDIDRTFKITEAAIEVYEKELRVFKDLFEKNTNYPNKMLKYYVKGIVLPVCAIIKLIFCYTGDCNGYNILMLYQIMTKMLFIKSFIMDIHNSFLAEKKIPQFDNFDLAGFLNKEKIEEDIEDYFSLKDRDKFSPYDFTYLWEIFEKHFLNYIKYPESLNLEEKFPFKEIDTVIYGNISEETDLLDSINLNTRKKGRNALFRKGKLNKGKDTNHSNYLMSTVVEPDISPNAQTTHYNIKTNDNDNVKIMDYIDLNNEEKQKQLVEKIKNIYEFYCEEKRNINENNSSFLISLPELCREYELNFRRILLGVLINLPGEGVNYKTVSRIILYKLLVITTSETQNDICLNMNFRENKELGFLINISNSLYINLVQCFINDFNYDFLRFKSYQTVIFNDIKILKLLCEQHNNFFKEKLLMFMNYNFSKYPECKMTSTNKSKFFGSEKDQSPIDSDDSMSFFNFLINCLHKILIITKKAHNENHIEHLFDLFFVISELLVEVIQGNKKEILSKGKANSIKNHMSLFTFRTFISVVSQVLFDDSLIMGYAFKTRLLLISFFIAILEEKNNEEIQKCIMKFFTLNKVIASIIFTMKKYFYEKTKDDIQYKEYYSNFNEKQISQMEFIFDHTVFSFFKYHYFHSNVSKESKEFELANNYYKYIKELSVRGKSPEAEELIKQTYQLSEEEAKVKFALFNKKSTKPTEIAPINLINEKEKSISISFIENYYIFKFFEIITKVVEIRLPQEERNVNVIFTVPCEMIYLSEMTKEEFVYNVVRKNENTKKFELVRSIPLFQLEIEYFKNTKVGFLSKFILSLDFNYIQIVMYILATIFLIFMLFTLEGYTKIEPYIEEEEERRLRRLYRYLIEIPDKVSKSIDLSIEKWGRIYDFICYIFCGLNGILIISWIFVKMPLYYVLDKYKYMDEKKVEGEKKLSYFNKTLIMFLDSIIGRDYINSLLMMFTISLVGAIMKRGEIIYAFLLVAILNLNTTLKGITASIKVKGPELGASFLLLIFLVYFYSNLGFFYLNSNFAADIENDIPDNYCLCLSFCFMTNFDAGIRARGGAADQMIRISFERNTFLYVMRLFYDITYFLICIIIMIDLVFGIILGTFSEMREEERISDNDKINHCFLCHIKREMIEKKKEDFHFHREKRHNLWTYVDYMIFLKFSEKRNLNAINLFSRVNLDNKNICFLPSYQDIFQEDEKKEEKEKEEEEEEEEEEEDSEENSDSSSMENNDGYHREDIDSEILSGYKNFNNDSSANDNDSVDRGD